MKDTLILAIESSCDETAASVVKNGRTILSNVISSQIALHTLYGGVVPEIASRKHIEKINQVIEQALADADVTLDDLDAIGVTYGPGLVGALLVGVAEAKAIAYAKKLPLVGVHHIEGHVSANYIEHPDLEPPFLCLIVSGGHTHLVIVKDYGEFEILGRTRDDAAGEAFDKVARAIGLGYFIIAFLVGLVIIFIAPESAKVPLTIQIILLAIFIVLLVVNIVHNNKIQQNIAERAENIRYIDGVCRTLDSILLDCQDTNTVRKLRQLYDIVHASPVMSNEAAWYIEDDIMNSVLNLEKQVRAMPVDQVNMEVERLINAAQKRNLVVRSK